MGVAGAVVVRGGGPGEGVQAGALPGAGAVCCGGGAGGRRGRIRIVPLALGRRRRLLVPLLVQEAQQDVGFLCHDDLESKVTK